MNKKKDILVTIDLQEAQNLYELRAMVQKFLSLLTEMAESETDIIFSHLGYDRLSIFLDGKTAMPSSDTIHKISQILLRRKEGIPIQYILEKANFYGENFYVASGVLIPRPETELLVSLVDERISQLKKCGDEILVLEVGVGSGALISILAEKHTGAEFFGLDISNDALQIAIRNVNERFLKNVKLECFDYLRSEFEEIFDIIYSNPPYIPESDRDFLSAEVRHEPEIALFAGVDGLDFYKKAMPLLCKGLKKEGMLFLEVGKGQAQIVAEVMKNNGFSDVKIKLDYNDVERFVIGVKNV